MSKQSFVPIAMIQFVSLICIAMPAWGQDAGSKQVKESDVRVHWKSIPIPKGVTEQETDKLFGEITYASTMSLRELADFYKRALAKKGWKTTDEFDDEEEYVRLDFENGEHEFCISLERDDASNLTNVTIDGDGIRWKKKKKASKTLGFAVGDIQLLDYQSSIKDGSMEILQFKSRKTVFDNKKHFEKLMKEKGWKLSQEKATGSKLQLRFEKDKMFVRIGLWPLTFSDNSGTHNGAGGAMTGTGLFWSGRQGIADVPERMATDAGKFMRLTPDKKRLLKESFRTRIEKMMRGELGDYRAR